MIKVLFLTNSLGGGGAERVLVNLVNHLDKTKFSVSVRTIFADGVNLKDLTASVDYSCKHITYFKGITFFLKFIPAGIMYKRIVGNDDFDLVIAFLHGISTKVVSGCKNEAVKKVAWLHYGDPHRGSFFKCWLFKKKAFKAYSKFNRIIGVSNTVSNAFKEYTKIAVSVDTLYNVNDTDRIVKLAEEPFVFDFKNKEIISICSVGRLANQKGYDRLISAVKRLYDEGYRFNLSILGEGAEHDALQRQIDNCGLSDVVHLLGFCENPYSAITRCDLFVSSSREEGLATVLTEALTLGVPILSTNVSGAKEVLGENNEYGLVVDNSENGIYFGIKKMLDNKELMNQYASTARERAILFDTNHTVGAVERMIEEICEN